MDSNENKYMNKKIQDTHTKGVFQMRQISLKNDAKRLRAFREQVY